MTSTGWTAADLSDQTGRRVVITGANSGLGLVTARELAGAGAHVVLAVRDTDKGRAAAARLPGSTEVRALDLADLASVRAFADAWEGELDVLVDNAGVMATPHATTRDGFELQFGTNHLGHFALTNLLLPHVTDRVVVLASGAHRGGVIRRADLNWAREPYRSWAAYQQSKLANLLFLLELQRRLTADGSRTRALAAHPGYAATNLQGRTGNRLLDAAALLGNKVLAQSDAMGALPTLFAATVDLPGGSYAGPSGPLEMWGYPTLVGRSAAASDPDTARWLWDASEQLTGVTYGLARATSGSAAG